MCSFKNICVPWEGNGAKIWCLLTHINISLRFQSSFQPALTTGTEHVTCFPRRGIVSLDLTEALFKEVAVTPVSCHSTFYLYMWEAHWDILMAPPLLMTSSPSSFIFIFNCLRQHRKKKKKPEITGPLCTRVRACACASACHRKCSLRESAQKRKMALSGWGETEKLAKHGKEGS